MNSESSQTEARHQTMPGDPGKKMQRMSARARRSALTGYAFLAPWLFGILFLAAAPIGLSFYFSLTEYNLISPPEYVGFRNYSDLWTDPNFHDSIWVTLKYVLISVPLKLALALAVAMLLNREIKGLGIYRVLYYFPSLIGASVAMALVWRMMFSGNGVINQFLGPLGIPTQSWITDPSTSVYTLIILSVWQFGSPMIIFLAGLKQIPVYLYEASRIDGASKLNQFWTITLPLLSPVIFFNIVLKLVDGFQAFTPAYVVSGGSGGPANSTLFYSLYLVQTAFRDLSMGYASAMAWILVFIIGGITAINFALARYWVFDENKDR